MDIQESGVLGITVPERTDGKKPVKEKVSNVNNLLDGEEERGDEFLPPLFVD